ncbi:lipopolysaccharide biosynthesis protein [Paeniglutamicibacter sp. ORCA_105]|uniref:lipopolysaccharide biosynthesis protein n=1 Tax=Paeniglutamicibacter sp. ORCA_105 TaxID=3377336 RepID=UPI003896153D
MRVAGALLILCLVAIVALHHGKVAVGLNGILWSAAVIARTAGTFGLDLISLRAIATVQEQGRDIGPIAARYRSVLFRIWAVCISVVLLICFVIAFWSSEVATVLLICLIACAASGMQRLWYVHMIASGRIHLAQSIESVGLPLLAIVGALLTSGAGVAALLISQAVAYLITGIAFWLLSPGRGAVPAKDHRIIWRAVSTNFFASAFTAIAVRAPIFFVGATSAASAGAYEIAQRVQSAGSLGVTAVSTSVLPVLARTAKSARRRTMGLQLAGMGVLACLMPATLLMGLLLIGEDRARGILGDEYGDVWLPTTILMVAALVNASTSCISNLLAVSSLESSFLATSALQLCVLLATLAWLQDASPLSASIAVLVSEAVRSLGLVVAFIVKYQPLESPHGISNEKMSMNELD